MTVQNQFESVLRDEWHQLVRGLRDQVTDPEESERVVAMANDALLLPLRIARGEDVVDLARSLHAEARNVALAHRTAAQTAVTIAWTRAAARLLGAVILGV